MLVSMGEQEILKTLGCFVEESRKNQGLSRLALARTSGVDVKTIRTLEAGVRKPYDHTLRMVESALGWRTGAIDDLWDQLENDNPVTLDMLTQAEKPVPYPGAIRAAHLTDEELTAELSYRLTKYAREAEKAASSSGDE